MKHPNLVVTYRRGKFEAAYLDLARRSGDRSVRTELPAQGLVVDYAADGRPIGVEILSKSKASLEALNHVLKAICQEPVPAEDLAPLLAAG